MRSARRPSVADDESGRGAHEYAQLPGAIAARLGRGLRARPRARRADVMRPPPGRPGSTPGRASPKSRLAVRSESAHLAGRQLDMARVMLPLRRRQVVDLEQAGERGRGRGRRRIDDGHVRSPATPAMTAPAADSGCSRGATCRCAPSARQREDELAIACRARRAAVRALRRTVARTSGPSRPAGLDQRHELGRRVFVDLDEGVLVLDGLEVGVRADRGLASRSRPPGACAWPGPQPWRPGGRRPRSARRSERRIVGSATADEVLQATTMALTSRAASSSRHSRLKRTTSSSARGP